MVRTCVVLLGLLGLLACDSAEEGGDASVPGTECVRAELAAQCPPGSSPAFEVDPAAACAGEPGAEITNESGGVDGVCQGTPSCLVVCNFADPCPCGVDRITNAGVFCVDCRTAVACGNGACEGGESPETCPVDCAPPCAPGAERCAGEAREVCDDRGRWATVRCDTGRACAEAALTRGLTWCEPRLSPSGGTWPGTGAAPTEVADGANRDIRFFRRDLPCGQGCRGLARFVEEGRAALFIGDRIALTDLASGAVTELPTPVISTFRAASEAHFVFGGRRPRVGDLPDGAWRGLDALVQDEIDVQPGPVAIAPDGAHAAVNLTIEGAPVTALWIVATGELRGLLRFIDPRVTTGPTTALAFSPNGAVLAEGRSDGLVVLWNVEERRTIGLIQSTGRIGALAFSPAGAERLLVGGARAELWRLPGAEAEARRLWTVNHETTAATIATDGVIALSGPQGLLLVDATDGAEVFSAQRSGPVDFHPAGGLLLVGAALYSSEF